MGLLAVIAPSRRARLSARHRYDIAIFLRTRVTSTARLVLTRFAVLRSSRRSRGRPVVAWYGAWALIGRLPADKVLIGAALRPSLLRLHVVAVVALASGVTRGSVSTMFLAFAIVLVPQITLGLVGGLGDWLPGHLSGAIAALNDGSADPVDYVRSVLVTVVVIVAALAAAVRLLDRREV
ncbi:MAG: hypothetical protein H6675_05240 [Dehalococcoidia bacterium]|nr:hypothetical protein [Dehalococcoidia bacterium]